VVLWVLDEDDSCSADCVRRTKTMHHNLLVDGVVAMFTFRSEEIAKWMEGSVIGKF